MSTYRAASVLQERGKIKADAERSPNRAHFFYGRVPVGSRITQYRYCMKTKARKPPRSTTGGIT